MTYNFDDSLIQLIDKTNSIPTGITEGGLIDGDLKPFYARLTQKKGDGLVPSAVLSLYVQLDGKFVRTAPILIDKDAPDKYLIQIEMKQDGKASELQRYRLSTPTFTDDPDLGEIMQITLESIAYDALMETRSAINDELVTPKQRVENILNSSNVQGGAQHTLLLFNSADIDIPDNDSLQFDYLPTSPKPIGQLLDDVIERIEQAGPLGGVFRNFYYDTFANPLFTQAVQIFFEEFGLNDSGVIINPDNDQEASPNDKALLTSNKKRKKIALVKFGLRSGSLRMEHARFASNFIHASNRSEWVSSQIYLEGDVVKLTDNSISPNIIRFFIASNDIAGTVTPDQDNLNWFEDFTVIPPFSGNTFYTVNEVVTFETGGAINYFFANTANGPSPVTPNFSSDWTPTQFARPASRYVGFTTYTPFTNDLFNSQRNLAAIDSPPAGYVGYALDWNYERILNDIPDYTNRFKIVTGKSIRRIENNPPSGSSRELYDGFRVLVGTSPAGDFVGHANQIAEYVRDFFQGILPHWEFSDDPITNDTIPLDHQTGNALTFNGASWVTAWTISDNIRPAPVHLVRSMQLVKGSSGIPGQALQQRFDWKDSFEGGEDNNRTSRGAWYHDLYPKPISDSISTNLGGTYGGDGLTPPLNPRINHINLNRNRKGQIGYDRGLDSEDMGRITEHAFKTKLGIFRSSDETEKSKGKKNIPMVYWRKDSNSRFFFKDFSIPENNEFFTVDVKLPPFGPTNLYFNRIDELTEVYGYTLPYDFFIQEKEFSGVRYEFRRNDSWGYFMKGSYNDVGLYTGSYKNYIDRYIEAGTQLIPDILEFINDIATGQDVGAFVTSSSDIDHTTLTTDEEYYVKEGYAIFPTEPVDDPRTDWIQMQEEVDYLTARAKANARVIKNDFYPNERHIAIGTNLDIQYGQEVTETGSRVPSESLKSVVSYKEEIYDNKGTNTRLFLVRKFVIT